MKNSKLKNNDFLISQNIDNATTEQKIALLNQIIDNELEKNEDQADMTLVDECMAFIEELEGGQFVKSNEELCAGLQRIMAKAASKKTVKSARTNQARVQFSRTVLKRLIMLGAIIIILLMTSIAATAERTNYDSFADWLDANLWKLIPGVVYEIDGNTVYKSTKYEEYSSVNKFVKKTGLNVLYPAELPEGFELKNIARTFYSDDPNEFEISFSYNSLDIQFNAINYKKQRYDYHYFEFTEDDIGLIEVDGRTVSVISTPYGFQANFLDDQYAYSISCANYDNLLFILNHLKGTNS